MDLRKNEMKTMLNLAGIVNDSIVDGPGIRVVFFAQGCPHQCKGCHNPQSHPFGTGENREIEALLQLVQKNPLVKGVTFSGGEPFCQAAGFAALAKALKANHYEVAAYTGYQWEELMQGTEEQKELLRTLDILIDGKFILAEKTLSLRFRGSANQRILNVPESLKQKKPVCCIQERWTGIEVSSC